MEEMVKKVKGRLARVMDPELGISIVDLGLIYGVEVRAIKTTGKYEAKVVMTLTSMGCPLAGAIESMVRKEAAGVAGVSRVRVEIVWEPVWTPEKMDPKVRAELGLD